MNEDWGTPISQESPEYSMDKRKMWGGGFLFFLVVGLHLIDIFEIRMSNPIISIVVTQGLIVVPAFIYMACWGGHPLKFMRFRKFHIGSAFLIPILMFTLIPIMGVLNAFSQLFSTESISSSINDITGGNVLIGVLCVALLPAIVEETTFRGAIYHSMRGAHPVRAIILSGFCFGAMHMNFNQFVYATALGIIMGFLLEATGSILSTMILHFCFNANSVILMCLLPKLMEMVKQISPEQYSQMNDATVTISKTELLSTIAMLLPMAIGGAGIAFALFFLIAKLNKRWEYIKFLFAKRTKPQREALPKPGIFNAFLVIALIACFTICVLNELAVRGIIKL